MNPDAPEHHAVLDLSVPPAVELLAAGEDGGEVQMRRSPSGERLFLYAEPATRVVLMGVPTDRWQGPVATFYERFPIARMVRFVVTDRGRAERLPGPVTLPAALAEDPRIEAVRSELSGGEHDAPSTGAGGAGAEADRVASGPEASAEERARHPYLHPAPDGGAVWAAAAGEPVPVVRQEGPEALALELEEGARFVCTPVPTDIAERSFDQLVRFYREHPDHRPSGRAMRAAGEVCEAPEVLEALERAAGEEGEGLRLLVGDGPLTVRALAAARRARREERLDDAPTAATLEAWLDRHEDTPPDALAGTDGTLYAPVAEPIGYHEGDLAVRGVGDVDTERVLRLELPDPETGEVLTHLYAPAPGRYVVAVGVGGDGLPDDESQVGGRGLRADGEAYPLSSTDRMRVWSRGQALPVRSARSARDRETPRESERPSASERSPVPESAASGGGPGREGDVPLPEDDAVPAPADGGASPPLARRSGPDEDGPAVSEPRAPGDAPRAEGAARPEPGDVHDPTEGYTNVENWRRRSPRGELWVSELLRAVADAGELDEQGCLVPLRLFRKGYAMSASDKDRIDRSLRDWQGRVDDVRIFQHENRSYFLRDTGEGLRLIGPRGRHVRDDEVRAMALELVGEDASRTFLEPDDARVQRRRGGR